MMSTGCSQAAVSASRRPPVGARSVDPLQRVSELLRIPTFVGITIALTASGHMLGHGGSPSPLGVLLVGVLAAAGRAVLGTRRHGVPALAGLAVASQWLGHVLLETGDPSASLAGAGHHHPQGALLSAVPAESASSAMLLAHLLAAVACAWWLHTGEARAAQLARQLTRPLPQASPLGSPRIRTALGERSRCAASALMGALAPGRSPPAFT